MSVYFSAYKNENNGSPAYSPTILLKIILFAYSKGIISSRQIEWHCKTNIIFKALSCDTVPHNTTIAMNEDVYETGIVITADTGFADEPNMQYLYENNINGYVPDNQFRKRGDKYKAQTKKHGKRSDYRKNSKAKSVIPASEFRYDPTDDTCICPEGHLMTLKKQGENQRGIETVMFHCKASLCKACPIISACMRNPLAIRKRNAIGRQVSFVNEEKRKPTYTDWMKEHIDSIEGKLIYGHRMSVIEPVFGNLSNKGLKKFSLRGKEKVQCQFKLYCLVHNIEKIKNYGKIAA